jgi:uncharacterized membrane protein HdeD (DUF308 family)
MMKKFMPKTTQGQARFCIAVGWVLIILWGIVVFAVPPLVGHAHVALAVRPAPQDGTLHNVHWLEIVKGLGLFMLLVGVWALALLLFLFKVLGAYAGVVFILLGMSYQDKKAWPRKASR